MWWLSIGAPHRDIIVVWRWPYIWEQPCLGLPISVSYKALWQTCVRLHASHTCLKTPSHNYGTCDSLCCSDIWPLRHKYSSLLCKGVTTEGGLCEVMARVWSCLIPRCTSRKQLSGLICKWLLKATAPLFWHCWVNRGIAVARWPQSVQ